MAHPLAFLAYLKHIGAPVDGYFRRQKLPVLLKDPNDYVSLSKAWDLFNDAAERECYDLGWHVGDLVGAEGFSGAMLSKLENAGTLYLALKSLVRLSGSEASLLKLGILEREFDILFCTHYPGMHHPPGYRSSQAYQLAVYIDFVRHFTGSSWCPSEIGIEGSNIPAICEDFYPASAFRVNQPFGYIAIRRRHLSSTLLRKHRAADSTATLDRCEGVSYGDLVARLLKPYLPQGYPTLAFAAELAGTSPRTLSRRLSDAGTGYQDLVDELRFKVSCSYLAEQDRPISDISWSVGFTDQANFTRFFWRMAGTNPRDFRKSQPHRRTGTPSLKLSGVRPRVRNASASPG